ncbi:MAG TPA: hypothetical protein VND68_03045 [Chloroflexia bacterium]|jgi:hypothetical protein|nr:hypothetical protein [Chloroflexia bacterium]
MLQTSVRDKIINRLDGFTVEQQQKILEYMESLASRLPAGVGTAGSNLLHYAGTLPKEEAEEMMRAIEEQCERIDTSDW